VPFLETIGIGKVLQSVGTSLASKAPAAAYGKWSASRQTQEDFAAAWTHAREKTIGEYSGFGAIVDEAELQKVVFEHALNPYLLKNPNLAKLHDAVSVRHPTPEAEHATEKFLEHFTQAWVSKKSFRDLGLLFEDLRQTEGLTELSANIERAFETIFRTGVPVRLAAIPPPSPAVLAEYCQRIAQEQQQELLLNRRVFPEGGAAEARSEPGCALPLEQALGEHPRVAVLGEGGLGKTMAMRGRERDMAAQFGATGTCVPVYLKMAEYQGGSIEQFVARRVNDVLTGSGLRLGESAEESERAVRAWLEGPEMTVELLLDGVNEIGAAFAGDFQSRLDGLLRYKQKFLFTARSREGCLPPGLPIKAFLLSPLTSEDIREMLRHTLQQGSDSLYERLMADSALSDLAGNPFLLHLFSEYTRLSPVGALPESRGLLIREFTTLAVRAMARERLAKAGRAGVLPRFLQALGWELLLNGAVSTDYATVYEWNLPTSGLPLDELLSGASSFRLLRSAALNGEPIEFVHPLFRDYYAAERISTRLQAGENVAQATEGNYGSKEWNEALRIGAGLCVKTKAGELVMWLASNSSVVLAFDCWGSSEARHDQTVTQAFAGILRNRMEQYLETRYFLPILGLVSRLGTLRDAAAVPLIERYIDEGGGGSWGGWRAASALEAIRSPEAMRVLVRQLESTDHDTKRYTREALERIGVDAVPALLHSASSAAESILHEMAGAATAAITAALSDPETHVRALAARTLGSTRDQAIAPVLIPALTKDDPPVRIEAAMALGRLANPSAAHALEIALGDDNRAVRFNSAYALWTNGWSLTEARRALFGMYRDEPDSGWKPLVLECLMTRPDREIEDLVMESAADTQDFIRAAAFGLLSKVASVPRELILSGLRDDSISVRRRAVDLLISSVGGSALPELIAALEKDPAERYELLEAIPQMGDPGRDYLVRFLQSRSDEWVRTTAVTQLARFNDPKSTSALIAALEIADPQAEPRLTAGLIESLRKSRDPAVLARLEALAVDESAHEYVRELASEVLAAARRVPPVSAP
jgi:HEAT repeat protein